MAVIITAFYLTILFYYHNDFFAMDPRVGIISFVPFVDIVSFFCIVVDFFMLYNDAAVASGLINSPFLGKTTPVRVTISWVT